MIWISYSIQERIFGFEFNSLSFLVNELLINICSYVIFYDFMWEGGVQFYDITNQMLAANRYFLTI